MPLVAESIIITKKQIFILKCETFLFKENWNYSILT